MKVRADFHIHTHYSVDSSLPPEELLKRAKEKGLDVIGVVDHGTCKGALDTRKLAHHSPLVIIGQEVRTLEGEIIVFGPEKDIGDGLSLKETCTRAKKLGGFIIAPHPFDKLREGIGDSFDSVLEYIDAIEGFNSQCVLKRFNEKAQEFAAENGKPVVAGSDAHFSKDVGKAVTILELDEITQKAVFEAIRKGRTRIVGSKTGLADIAIAGFRKRLKTG